MTIQACFILVVTAALLAGCTSDPNLSAVTQQPLKVTTFSGGREVSDRLIPSSSPEHEKLTSWLMTHQKGWKRSYASYAPSVLVSGTNFSMNIRPASVILNVGGHQYERVAQASDFKFLSP